VWYVRGDPQKKKNNGRERKRDRENVRHMINNTTRVALKRKNMTKIRICTKHYQGISRVVLYTAFRITARLEWKFYRKSEKRLQPTCGLRLEMYLKMNPHFVNFKDKLCLVTL